MLRGPDQILRLIAFGLGALAMIAAAFEFRDALDAEPVSAPAIVEDTLRGELARCRTLTFEEFETDTPCRDAWAENRRRFFGGRPDDPDAE